MTSRQLPDNYLATAQQVPSWVPAGTQCESVAQGDVLERLRARVWIAPS